MSTPNEDHSSDALVQPIVTTRKGIGGHTSPNRGATDSWITPKEIIDALGEFDLDPCRCTPQPWECARKYYTIADDGLRHPWFGRVWLNPPYSEVWQWMDRLANHGRGTALIFARTEVKGFVDQVWRKASAVMFLHGRLFFHHPDGSRAKGNSGGPSCLVAYGDDDARRLGDSGLAGSIVSGWHWSLPRSCQHDWVAVEPYTIRCEKCGESEQIPKDYPTPDHYFM